MKLHLQELFLNIALEVTYFQYFEYFRCFSRLVFSQQERVSGSDYPSVDGMMNDPASVPLCPLDYQYTLSEKTDCSWGLLCFFSLFLIILIYLFS